MIRSFVKSGFTKNPTIYVIPAMAHGEGSIGLTSRALCHIAAW
jgi:hypothetical protein